MSETFPEFYKQDKENELRTGEQARGYLSGETDLTEKGGSSEGSESGEVFAKHGTPEIIEVLGNFTENQRYELDFLFNQRGEGVESFQLFEGEIDEEDAQDAQAVQKLLEEFRTSDNPDERTKIADSICGLL